MLDDIVAKIAQPAEYYTPKKKLKNYTLKKMGDKASTLWENLRITIYYSSQESKH